MALQLRGMNRREFCQAAAALAALRSVVKGGEPGQGGPGLRAGEGVVDTTWLGFVSDGTQDAVYYLDNLRLSG